MTISRRSFNKLALAALPLTSALAKMIDSKVAGVQLGVQSYSFRDLQLDEAIQAMVTDGLGDCELFSPHLEPGGPAAAIKNWMTHDPAVQKQFADNLRQWRISTPISYFEGIRKKFSDAGVHLYAFNYSFDAAMTDPEIDRGFQMAKALGVGLITASTTLSVAQRVVPFAAKHKILVAMHGHSDIKDPEQFATPESFSKALKMSPNYRINLDIGHFTAAGFDPVDFIQQHHDKIVLLHLKDRKKNDGPNTPWGQGDTPIKGVLQLLKANHYPIPAFIEYEYEGTGSSVEEVAKCYEYAKAALA
jgi:sugar phosphate isomerase/epimerase